MNSIPVISIVAYSGTGKTTLLEKLIPELKRHGLRLAVIKHDGHNYEFDKPGKDSWRITRAGADMTVLTSASQSVIMENRPLSLEELLAKIENVDLILLEGYKFGGWPKIMLHRKATGKPLPVDPDTCLAVLSDSDEPVASVRPCLDINDVSGLTTLILEEVAHARS